MTIFSLNVEWYFLMYNLNSTVLFSLKNSPFSYERYYWSNDEQSKYVIRLTPNARR